MKDETTQFAHTLNLTVKWANVKTGKKNEKFGNGKLGKKRNREKFTLSQISWSPLEQKQHILQKLKKLERHHQVMINFMRNDEVE